MNSLVIRAARDGGTKRSNSMATVGIASLAIRGANNRG